jgi:hypothetical protein
MSTTPSAAPQPSPGGPAPAPAQGGSGAKIVLWIFGGCLGIVVIGCVVVGGLVFWGLHKAKQAGFDPELMKKNPVLAVAKLSVAGNRDVEMVSSDDSSGTIVVRDKKTGKTSTMKVDPDKRIMVVTDEDGKTVTMKLDPSNTRLVVTDDRGKIATITANQNAGSLEIKGDDGSFKMGGATDKAPSWVPAYPGVTPTGNFSASSNLEQTGSFSFVTSDSTDKVINFYSGALKQAGLGVSQTTTNSNGKIGGIVTGTSDADKRSVMVTFSAENDGTHVGVVFSSKKQPN